MKIKDFFIFTLIYPILKIIEFLPIPISDFICKIVLIIISPLLKERFEVARKNLRIVFPDKSEDEIEKINRKSYLRLSEVVVFLTRLKRLNSLKKISKYVSLEGYEKFKKLKEGNRGVILITGHFCLWELLPSSYVLKGNRLNFIYRAIDNIFLDRYVFERRAINENLFPVEKRKALGKMVRALKKGDDVGILIDQNVLKKDGVFVDFFGKKASTTPIAAYLSLKIGSPVVPVFMLPAGKKYRYKFKFFDEIDIERDGDFEELLKINTEKMMKVFEDLIKKYPHCWLWIHRKWKTRPEGEENIY